MIEGARSLECLGFMRWKMKLWDEGQVYGQVRHFTDEGQGLGTCTA